MRNGTWMAAWLVAAAIACGTPPRPRSTSESAGDACRKTIAALGSASPDGGAAAANLNDFDARARVIDDERKAILASGLADDASGNLATYTKRSEEAAEACRNVAATSPRGIERESADFAQAMSTFIGQCKASDCFAVILQIGMYTMHQPRLDQTLPLLADELDKAHLADPAMQAELVKLAAKARKTGASLAKRVSLPDGLAATAEAKKKLEALETSRAALRERCSKP